MSLPAFKTCTRIISPHTLRRIAPGAQAVGQACQMSSSTKKETPAKPTKSKAKPTASKGASSSDQATAAPVIDQTAATPVIEKGDTYKVGEEFFSYTPYSFYDVEFSMEQKRIPQPSSEKAS